NQNALTKVSEGLASGKRINRAGDDAAGAAVSSAMTSQIRGMKADEGHRGTTFIYKQIQEFAYTLNLITDKSVFS
ncbi:flagellin N-terminal helical domain-containing protein, partial [Bacillus cereus]